MTPTKYVAFDLDGTLIDADELHFVALNRALAACGSAAIISRKEHLETFKGLPTTRKLDMLVAAGRVLEKRRTEVAQMKQERTLDAIRETLRPDPEKIEVLRALKAGKWRICVCSNAVRESVKEMLVASGLIDFLDFYLSNQDAPPKPDPGIYLKAARLYGIVPVDLIVVEDAAPGKAAARAAGCRLVEIDGPGDVVPWLILQRLYRAAGMPDPRLAVRTQDVFVAKDEHLVALQMAIKGGRP